MPNPLDRVGQLAGSVGIRLAIGQLGKALGEWLLQSGLSPEDVDRAFAEGKQNLLLAGLFQGIDANETRQVAQAYAGMARAMGPAEYARILDSAAYQVPQVAEHCDVIGRLHWAEYEAALDDLKERFLAGRPLVDAPEHI